MSLGGPLETVKNGKTGLLVPKPFSREEVADKLAEFLIDEKLASKLGKSGKEHVDDNFSFDAFANQLERICLEVL